MEKALQDVKGIGPVVWNRIQERLAELFRKEKRMKALTIWQPWAQLLATGTKSIETRKLGEQGIEGLS